LNGKKILIRGNHDHQNDEWYLNNGFLQVHDFLNIGDILFVHYPLQEAVSRGFDHTKFGTVEHVIHGHVHTDKTPNFENHFNVAVDRNDFYPVDSQSAIPAQFHDKFFSCLSRLL
jgi:calcineurin-like phosphoesterase family protein